MLSRVRDFLRFKVLAPFRINFFPSYNSSHSQFGEDMLIRGHFGSRKNGFYVDIGAHHPVYYSNTYHFYLKGWNGVNIEATPEVINLFNQLRSRDKNINACIGKKSGELVTFFEFEQAALNTISESMAKDCEDKGHKIIRKREMTTVNINDLLEKHVPKNKEIDFLTIDIEGLDNLIITSLNFDRFSPAAILVEDHKFKIEHPESEMLDVLRSKGYTLEGKCGPSLMFIRNK